MIPVPWVQTAAERIVDSLRGEYAGTYEENVEAFIAIITEQVPFKVDVAYMPVPRCDQCRHWQQFELENVGKCLEADLTILFSASKCGLETKDDFGCVRWEATLNMEVNLGKK